MSVYVNPKKWARVGNDGLGPLSGKELAKSQSRSDDDNQYVKYKMERMERTDTFKENYTWQDDPITLIDAATVRAETPDKDSAKHVKRNVDRIVYFQRPNRKPSY